MPRILFRRGKAALIRELESEQTDPAKRKAQTSRTTSTGDDDPKRPRQGDTSTAYDEYMHDVFPHDDDDDDYPGGMDALQREQSVDPRATDFDDAELAQSVLQGLNDEDFTVFPDASGEYQLADEVPLQEELQDLAALQIVDDTTAPQEDEVDVDQSGDEGDEEDIETTADMINVVTSWSTAPGLEPEPTDPFVDSGVLSQPHKTHDMDDFSLGLGLFCIRHNITRQQYSALKQLLALLKKGDGLVKLDKLPGTVDTLKRHTRETMPHIEIRNKEVALNPKKLSASRTITTTLSGKDPVQNLYYLNPIDMIRRILSSQLTKEMHFGMAHLVDNPTEAYHSAQWAGAIRTTSGDFVFYPETDDPIFPGDIVDYRCAFEECKVCKSLKNPSACHIGQVIGIYRDFRGSSRKLGALVDNAGQDKVDELAEGSVIMILSRVWDATKLLSHITTRKIEVSKNPAKKADLVPGEMILCIDPQEYVSSGSIIRRRDDISFDYSYGSHVSFSDDPEPSAKAPSIRRIFSRENKCFLPVCKASPVPSLLEVNQYSRDELTQNFARATPDRSVRCMPLFNFSDGFGLYRTMYKSIMGVYLLMASLPRSMHTRQINVLPLTLGPHGSNFEDVMKAMLPMRALERGILLSINGEDIMVCAPLLGFQGDMVQQNENCGCLGVTANHGCRHCEVATTDRGNLEYDILTEARAHPEMVRLRRSMDGLPSMSQKRAFSSEHGISIDKPPVMHIAPSLDLIACRPGDSAHSEFGGITKMTHQLLIDVAFTSKSVVEYAKALRQMPFPPGFERIQTPYHVLQYSLREHAQWSVLMTILCLYWLKEDHLKLKFVQAMKAVFSDEIGSGKSVVDVLTIIMSKIVSTNGLLSTDDMTTHERTPHVFNETIRSSRGMFQRLCEAAALSTTPASGAAATAAASRRGSMAPPPRRVTRASSVSSGPVPSRASTAFDDDDTAGEVLPSIEHADTADDIVVGELSVAQKAVKYRKWASRPNVHTGLHYADVLRRYGLVSLLMTLPGEKKHKLWKTIVVKMNHQNPEKDCLLFEDLIQSVRLTLHDGFASDDPAVTAQVKGLATDVPALFAALKPDDDMDADAHDPSVSQKLYGDDTHVLPAASCRLDPDVCKRFRLPTREKKMSKAFYAKLAGAYASEYQKQAVIITSNLVIKWWKKVSFQTSHDSTIQRTVFKRGQYIAYRGNKLARLDHMFTHELLRGYDKVYIFLVITPLVDTGRREPLTDLPILKPISGGEVLSQTDDPSNTYQDIIGLTALDAVDKMYMVPYDPADRVFITADAEVPVHSELLHVNWRMTFG